MDHPRYHHGLLRSDDARFGFTIVKYCKGVLDGRAFYAFIAIEPQNFPYVTRNYQPFKFSDFSAFGKELLRGWGENPPEDILNFIQYKHNIEFGINPAYLLHLAGLTHAEKTEGRSRPSTIRLDQKISGYPTLRTEEYTREYPEKPIDAQESSTL